MRSKGGVKPAIPWLTDSVEKLEGVGGKTRRNLLDVRRCARNIDACATVPPNAQNEIITGIAPRYCLRPSLFGYVMWCLSAHSLCKQGQIIHALLGSNSSHIIDIVACHCPGENASVKVVAFEAVLPKSCLLQRSGTIQRAGRSPEGLGQLPQADQKGPAA